MTQLYHSSRSSAYLKLITSVTSFKNKGLVSKGMMEVVRKVPPIQITPEMTKFMAKKKKDQRLPAITYPEDEWRERLYRDIGRSKHRSALFTPRIMYESVDGGSDKKYRTGEQESAAQLFNDHSVNWVEIALDKHARLMEEAQAQEGEDMEPEDAYEITLEWLMEQLDKNQRNNYMPLEAVRSYYGDVVKSEEESVQKYCPVDY